MIVIKDNSKIRKFPNSVPSVDSSNSTQASVIDLNNITNTIYKTGIELEGFFKKQGRERRPQGFKGDPSVDYDGDGDFRSKYSSLRSRDVVENYSSYWEGEVVREPKTITESYRFMNSAYPDRANSSCGMHVHLSFNNPLDQCWLMESEFENYLLSTLKHWADRNLSGDSYNKALLLHRLEGHHYCRRMQNLNFSYLRKVGLGKKHSVYSGNEMDYVIEQLKLPSTNVQLEQQGNSRLGVNRPNRHVDWDGSDKYLITNANLYKFGSTQGFQKNRLGTIEFRVLPAFDSKQLAVKIYTELVGCVIKYLNSQYIKDKTDYLRSEKSFNLIRRSRELNRRVVTSI